MNYQHVFIENRMDRVGGYTLSNDFTRSHVTLPVNSARSKLDLDRTHPRADDIHDFPSLAAFDRQHVSRLVGPTLPVRSFTDIALTMPFTNVRVN